MGNMLWGQPRKAIRVQQHGVVEKTRQGYFTISDKAIILAFHQQYLVAIENEYLTAKGKIEI